MTAVLLGGFVSGSSWEVVGNSLWNVLVPRTEMLFFLFYYEVQETFPILLPSPSVRFCHSSPELLNVANIRLIWWRCRSPRATVFWQQKDGEQWETQKAPALGEGWSWSVPGHSAAGLPECCAHRQTCYCRRRVSSNFTFSIKIRNFGIFYQLSLAYMLPCGLFCWVTFRKTKLF